jgi:hypothetical protein
MTLSGSQLFVAGVGPWTGGRHGWNLRRGLLSDQSFSHLLTSPPMPPCQSCTRRRVRMLIVLSSVPALSVEAGESEARCVRS